MKELIGKTIKRLFVSEGEQELIFDTDQGEIVYTTYGDCCSETWFADIVGVHAILGGRVASSEEIEVPDVEDKRCRQEVDSFYGVKMTTDKGHCDIIFRNSSNGYYGGSISLSAQTGFIGKEGTREILQDWSA